MLVILCIVTFILLFLYLYKNEIDAGSGLYSSIRLSLIKTLIIFSFLCYVSAELLSITNMLNIVYLSLYWCFTFLVIVYLCFRIKVFKCKFSFTFKNISFIYWIYILFSVFFILLPLLLLSILVPPNNWDSMTYHMPRVEHWIQNQNIYPYPTDNLRQIVYTPLAEYVILNFQILSGGDYFANLVQWFSMLGSLAVVSLCTKEFGLGYKGQFFSVLLALCIPMGVFQSTTTQTDYVAAFFLTCFIYFGYLTIHGKDRFLHTLFFMSSSLCLGGLTKYTTLIFSFPFCVWFAFVFFKMFPLKKIIITVFVLLVIASTIFLPFITRNLLYFQSPVGPESESQGMKNEKPGVINMLSNCSKNITDNLSLPIDSYNRLLHLNIDKFHRLLGISPDDPRNNFGSFKYGVTFSITEDGVSSPLHTILFILAGLFLVFYKNLKNKKEFLIFYLCIVLGLLFFSLLFKWQPWGNRFFLPLILVSSIISGSVIFMILYKTPYLLNILIILLIFYSLPPVYFNNNKTILPNLISIVRRVTKKPQGTLTKDIISFKIPSKYRERIFEYYDCTEVGYKVKPDLSNIKKAQLYELQDSLNFFSLERRTVFSTSRMESYFILQPYLYYKYKKIFDSIPLSCKKIALSLGGDSYEYPLWVMARKKFGNDVKLGYICETNKKFPKRNQYPMSYYDISIVESDREFYLRKHAK